MRVDPFARKCLMSDAGVVLKNCWNHHFRGISFKMVHISTNLYHWTANYCDKQVIHYSYTFSSIWPSCLCKVKHLGDSCNGVDHLVQWCRSLRNGRWTGTESQSRFLAFLCKYRHFTVHTLTGQSSKSLIVYQFFKQYQHVHVQHGKSTLVLKCEPPHMRTWKLDLMMQKDWHAM